MSCEHTPPEYLAKLLTSVRSGARFAELSARLRPRDTDTICPCIELAFLLAAVGQKSIKLADGEKADMHPLDSYSDALGEFSPQKLARMQRRSERLSAEIDELKKTPAVRELNRRGLICPEDLLGRSDFSCGSHFRGIKDLPDLLKKLLGDARNPLRPDFHEDLDRLHSFIHARSGQWYFEHVADLLSDILKKQLTGSALKQLRHRRDQGTNRA